jgi:hypothetical protein
LGQREDWVVLASYGLLIIKDEWLTLKDSLKNARTGCVATGLADGFMDFFIIRSSFQAAVGGFSSGSG